MAFLFWKRKNKPVKHPSIRLGLVLGGGGARGFGHLGVLKALSEWGVEVDIVAGTSVGSLVGALFCAGKTVDEIIEIAKNIKVKDVKSSKFFFMPSSSQKVEEYMQQLLGGDKVFSELKIPLGIVCTNMKNGQEVDIYAGSVAKAAAASSSVPGVFKPVVYNDMILVDGGLKNNVPCDVARKMGADRVIAVDVNSTRGKGTESTKMFKLLKSTIGVMMHANVESRMPLADVVLQPNLTEFSSSKLDGLEEMIDIGYKEALAHKEQIFYLLSKKLSRKEKKKWQEFRQNNPILK